MTLGLFGKLPAKRDFVAEEAAGEFLSVWEAWLQGGIAASKMALDRGWASAYLGAPLWRFRLGPAVCGFEVVGAFTPSVDGVGRHYPLTIFDAAAPGDAFSAAGDPVAAPWFDRVEAKLLAALEPDLDFAAFLADLKSMPLAPRAPAPTADPEIREARDCLFAPAPGEDGFAAAFEALEGERRRQADLGSCHFWTIGGEGFAAQALDCGRLPDPYGFDRFLLGGVAAAAGEGGA